MTHHQALERIEQYLSAAVMRTAVGEKAILCRLVGDLLCEAGPRGTRLALQAVGVDVPPGIDKALPMDAIEAQLVDLRCQRVGRLPTDRPGSAYAETRGRVQLDMTGRPRRGGRRRGW